MSSVDYTNVVPLFCSLQQQSKRINVKPNVTLLPPCEYLSFIDIGN